MAISCYCRASHHSKKQGEGHSQYTVTHTLPKVASSNSSVSVFQLTVSSLSSRPTHPPKYQYSKPSRVDPVGLSLFLFCKEEQYSPSQIYTKQQLIRAINLSMGSSCYCRTVTPSQREIFYFRDHNTLPK